VRHLTDWYPFRNLCNVYFSEISVSEIVSWYHLRNVLAKLLEVPENSNFSLGDDDTMPWAYHVWQS